MSNPYELRFKILEMAQGYLADRVARSENMMFQAWEHAKETGDANMELWKRLQPETYSIDDIKKKASELYEFVEKK